MGGFWLHYCERLLGFHYRAARYLLPGILHAHVARDPSIQAGREKIVLLQLDHPDAPNLPVRSRLHSLTSQEKFFFRFTFSVRPHLNSPERLACAQRHQDIERNGNGDFA
jgi:hypothetical protein